MENITAPAFIELTRVQELAEKLAAHLGDPSQIDFCRELAEQILFSIKRIIFNVGRGDWPISGGGFHHASDDLQMLKKRKMLPKWSGQVRGPEGLRDDGHAWRKYGQKDILNSKHPRAYYRCSHSKSQGCPAIKQVQRCNDNPAVFNITYRGTHTCTDMSHQALPRCPKDSPQSLLDSEKSRAPKAESSNFLAGYENSLEFEDLFGPSSNTESCFQSSISPAFMSPTTSDSNCFPWSPLQRSNYVSQDADLSDIVLAATSATNSQTMDVSFGDDGLEDSILCSGADFRWPL